MKIEIEKLTLRNFKGAKHLEVPLQPGMNTIAGRNATGKTTVMDAFLWCLFGKDSEDRTDFNVKTLNADGEAEHHLEHSVELILKLDNQRITLKRVLEEKWTKPKGKNDQIFSGHETSYYVNEVPCAMKEYNMKVETICNPITFKLLTNPLHFPSMPWAKQRDILSTVVGEVNEADMPSSKAFAELLSRITGKTIKEYKAELAKKKELAGQELSGIQPRIDENDLKKGEIVSKGYDYVSIQTEIDRKIAEIGKIDSDIADIARQVDEAGRRRLEIQGKINKLKEQQQRIEAEVRSSSNRSGDDARAEFDKLSNNVRIKAREFSDLTEEIRGEEANITVLEQKAESLRKEWYKENDRTATFDPDISVCPTCKRPFDESDVEAKKTQITANFNVSRAKRLEEIQTEGKTITGRISEKKALVEELKSKAARIEGEISALKQQRDEAEKNIPQGIVSISPMLMAHEDYQANVEQIKSLEESLGEIQTPGVGELQQKRQLIESGINELRSNLRTKGDINDLNTRIDQLKARQIELNQIIANYEMDENTILDHTKTYIHLVEERVNRLFKTARFRMFNFLINGNEEETCECMVEGVPYRDLNNGMKITVGIDIINALSNYYHTHAPIFIDNAEAINDIPETRSQVIGLFVTEGQRLSINERAEKQTAKQTAVIEEVNA
jgi:chromosome segregation ATPase